MAHDPNSEDGLPPNLRFLKTLVTVLTATMIIGLVTIIVLFVIRLGPGTATQVPLPDTISLPEGTQALSVAWGSDHYVVVTADQKVLIYNANGILMKTVGIE